MATSTRDRISVDLRGLGPPLLRAARGAGRSPSELVREFVTSGLKLDQEAGGRPALAPEATPQRRSRICMRMTTEERLALKRAASAAAMDPGRFVATLTASADRLGVGAERPAMLSSLRECNVELSQLSRSLRHLAELLSTGNVSGAREYRDMLDSVERLVRRHLVVAAEALRQADAASATRSSQSMRRRIRSGNREA